MRHLLMLGALAAGLPLSIAVAQTAAGPYSVVKSAKVGGEGGFDYVYADSANRKLYVPRSGPMPRTSVYDLDTLALVSELATGGHGVAVDDKSGHGFASSKPVAMFDAKTLKPIKTIDVQGNPDGIMFDAFNDHVYVLSHSAPNATVIDSKTGNVVGTIDLGGAPEQAVSDGKGHVYVDLEDKGQIAVVDAKTMKVTAHYDLGNAELGPAGLAIDLKNHVLYAACHSPASMVMVNADSGKVLGTVPIGQGVDGATFNQATGEAFSSQGDGTLSVVKQSAPGKFVVEQNVKTAVGAKTLTLDAKTGHVLLITAEYGPAPTPAPGTPPNPRARRGPMLPGSFTILSVAK